MAARRFPQDTLDFLRDSKILAIRAGKGSHRFIGIWIVVVGRRAFVRSWDVSPNGWNMALRDDPRATIKVKNRNVPVRAIWVRSGAIKNEVSRAYQIKYHTPGSLVYVRGFRTAKRKNSTLELLPA